jgi:hypothetical protein
MTATKAGQDYAPPASTILAGAGKAPDRAKVYRACAAALAHGLPELARPGFTPRKASADARAAARDVAEALGLIPTVQKPPPPAPVRKPPPRRARATTT